MTTREAAKELGVSTVRVHQFITQGRLKVRRVGNAFAISAEALEECQRTRRPVGRPPLHKGTRRGRQY